MTVSQRLLGDVILTLDRLLAWYDHLLLLPSVRMCANHSNTVNITLQVLTSG